MQVIEVHINDIIVYAESRKADEVMNRAHSIKKRFCITLLQQNGINAGVYVLRDGAMVVVQDAVMAQSKMNDKDFAESDDWFDDIIRDKKL